MPRKARTQSGATAQPTPSSVPGVRYGEGQRYSELQSNLPSPNNHADMQPPAASAGAQPLPAEAAAAQYAAPTLPLPDPGLLLAPTARPGEPVTTGLRGGPGEGPSALSVDVQQSPTGKLLRDLSRITGRQVFADVARRSGM